MQLIHQTSKDCIFRKETVEIIHEIREIVSIKAYDQGKTDPVQSSNSFHDHILLSLVSEEDRHQKNLSKLQHKIYRLLANIILGYHKITIGKGLLNKDNTAYVRKIEKIKGIIITLPENMNICANMKNNYTISEMKISFHFQTNSHKHNKEFTIFQQKASQFFYIIVR